MSIDTITLWPKSMDYPLFRKQLIQNAHHFKEMFIVFTGRVLDGQTDYTEFVMESLKDLPGIRFLEAPFHEGHQDWRDVAVNHALGYSTSDWILFLEQDFFWKPRFMPRILEVMPDVDAVSFWEAHRMHPAFLLVKREWIEKTDKYFGTVPEQAWDHFVKFSKDFIHRGGKSASLGRLGLISQEDWYHMQGITHNYSLVRDGKEDTLFKKHEFGTYNSASIIAPVQQDTRFTSMLSEAAYKISPYETVEWLKAFWT